MIHIIAKLVVKNECRSVFDVALADNLPKSRAEKTCLRLEAYIDNNDSRVIWLVEKWESEDALKLHYEQPYAKKIMSNLEKWLDEPVQITRCSEFNAGINSTE